ncbi:MAG: hypothetical protein ACLQU1_04790 [Bryobacteraceae bacterium]
MEPDVGCEQEALASHHGVEPIAAEEGFARLPRRQDTERPDTLPPTAAAIADCREFSLAPRRFTTQLGGLFLFLPLLVDGDLPGLVRQAGYPGSKMIPAPQAWLSLLGLKLSSTERKSHVMDLVFDEGLALFAGLNVVPKTTYLETYSHSFSPKINEKLRKLWIGVLQQKKLLKGESFNLDFHSLPFFGMDEFVERHYLSKRSRSQKSIFWFSWRRMPPPLPGDFARGGQHAPVGLAHRTPGCAASHVSDSQSRRPAGDFARL